MPQLISVPGMGQVSFPDNMSDADISSAIQKNLASKNQQNQSTDPSFLSNLLYGAKGALYENADKRDKLFSSGDEYKNAVKQYNSDEAAYNASPQSGTWGALIGKTGVNSIPYMMAPVTAAGGLLAKALTSAAANGGIGLLNDIADRNSFPVNAATDATLGGLVPPLAAAAKYVAKPIINAGKEAYHWLFPAEKVLNQHAQAIGDSLPDAVKVKQAGDNVGVQLTPAEASANPQIAQLQGKAGTSDYGSNKMYEFGKQHVAQQDKAVNDFIDSISKNDNSAASSVRDAANAEIDLQTKALRDKAAPIYKEAYKGEIPQTDLDNLLKNNRFKSAYSDTLHDPDYMDALGGKSPNGKQMISMWQNRIDNMIKDAQSRPYNQPRIDQLNYASKNLTGNFQDPAVQDIMKEIKLNDPVFHAAVNGINPRGIDLLDLVKKKLNSQSNSFGNKLNPNGTDLYKAGLINSVAKDLTNTIDFHNPYYAEARGIYGEGAQPLKELKQSQLGQIADTADTQLKTVSKKIFDPSQTDPNVMATLRDKISLQNPQAWRQIVRNEMESRLDKTINPGTGDVEKGGVNFYKKILAGKRDFNQFLTATQKIPGATQKLTDMRLAFKNLVNPVSTKTAVGLSKSSLDVPRSSMEAIKNIVDNLMGGRYDKAFVDFITNPKWDTMLQDYSKKQAAQNTKFGALGNSAYKKALKYGSILSRISAANIDINQNEQP